MDEEFKKPYDPKTNESAIYAAWESSGFFNPDNLPGNRPEVFSLVLPPPNVTGVLHIGHAFEDTLQDVAVRFNRMSGKKTLWVPGADHAAIATQTKVEKLLAKEGLNKRDLGREKFLEQVQSFAEDSKSTIISQVKRIGASLDWSRFAFTLDDKRKVAVYTAFKRLYELGLIYRGYKVVNWDPKGQTVISDDEVVHEERDAKLYTFKYWSDFPIAIATTRPETKLGDTAVAVHPTDPRYQKFIGQTHEGNFLGVPLQIKIIADPSIDPQFGTGALGVTPAHSQIDAELASKHYLPTKSVIDEFAKIIVAPFQGLKTLEAREKIVEGLQEAGLMEKIEDTKMNISIAERSGGIIEPLPKLQWFIDVNREFDGRSLKTRMREAVSSGKVKIIPDNFEKIYFNWIDNLRDWCISRQLWYGHRIPVWYKDEEARISERAPGEGWLQDEDTLDTWFSSGLWSFSTLGWPENTTDLQTYHPNSFMAPGYEILFFWVARMILMSSALLDEVPFKTVYIHGMVRDKNGEKFSKSKGNGVEPIEVIEKYGADALRMALIVGVGPGSDSKYDENKVGGYKKFANKIWNISRFILENNPDLLADASKITDEWGQQKLQEFKEIAEDLTLDMQNHRFYLAAEKIYHYTWHTFADIILEESKLRLKDESLAQNTNHLLGYLLKAQLTILHPFMPFVTEKIWSKLPNRRNLLIIEPWPINR